MTERKQDMWRITVRFEYEDGTEVRGPSFDGVVSLFRPMVALDAADHALRVAAAEEMPLPRIVVSVWGRADIGSAPNRLCEAVAVRMEDRGREYMRHTPWIPGQEYGPLGEPDGAGIIRFKK